ncbi:uncharacterized protein LOC129771106 isoform X1 [Toxorhynchites rutilus septentrionalis]|uniref:uncharacterized protein LOC129771106 isoform X1 n=1 Tax=Toxorhynchites rutilus septentrionalis TaxID=329112 RepID=UPI002479AE93|nr:uncharacterized protein LOC129771106 isoform X1 [Toxorhynchites rutilus septentrionalis]
MDQREFMISPDLMPAPELDGRIIIEQEPQENPQQVTVESLLGHIKTLTSNQNALIDELHRLRSKSEDPFLQFRTPDPIKNLATFAGNKKETHAWLEDAENTLALFQSYKNEPIYSQLVRAVKNKIIGDVKEILIAAGNPNQWEQIKEIILNSYGDRLDLTSHIQSLFYVNQGKKTLTEFYNQVKKIDTSIKATAALMDDYKSSTKAINSLISLMALTRFIDGLNDELSMHVRSYRPQSLEDAYSITMQYSNAAYRQRLNKQTIDQKTTKANNFKPSDSTNKNSNLNLNPFNQKPNNFNNGGSSNTKPSYPIAKSNGSGRFKNREPLPDDDVSMRTAKSRTEVNNHETGQRQKRDDGKNCGDEHDTSQQLEESILNSEDDDYFVDEELNFHVVEQAQGIKPAEINSNDIQENQDEPDTDGMTVHLADTSNDHYIWTTERPTNSFKNQIIFKISPTDIEAHEQIFTKYHRFIISKPNYTEQDIVTIFKEKLNPNGINCIYCPLMLTQLIQETYRKHFSHNKIFKLQDIRLPEEQDEIVRKTHDYAHRGIKENKAQILLEFFFPEIDKKLKVYINNCPTCKKCKYDRKPPKLVQKTNPAENTFERIHMDIFFMSGRKMLTIVDAFSKFANVIALETRTIVDLKRAITEHIRIFGKPKSITCDQEPSLTSLAFIGFMQDLDIEIHFASSSNSNGIVERFHSTLIELYRTLNSKYKDMEFFDKINILVDIYNNTIHSATGQSQSK